MGDEDVARRALPRQRRPEIAANIRGVGRVPMEPFACRFYASAQTIRRDLATFDRTAKAGKLRSVVCARPPTPDPSGAPQIPRIGAAERDSSTHLAPLIQARAICADAVAHEGASAPKDALRECNIMAEASKVHREVAPGVSPLCQASLSPGKSSGRLTDALTTVGVRAA